MRSLALGLAGLLGALLLARRIGVAPDEARRRIRGATPLLDVRTRRETARHPTPGAIAIPLHELPARAREVPRGPVLVTCAHGPRGVVAAWGLGMAGWDTQPVRGGLASLTGAGAGQ